jgi:hypothetical protein
MTTAADQLVNLVDESDPFAHDPEDIAALQLCAVNERLTERRAQIPVLERRLRDLDVTKVGSFDDIVPLLFAHTTYKSYPESFVVRGQWDRLLQWYSTLAVGDLDEVDLSGVSDLDGWVAAMWSAKRYAYASSGTSGKSSFLPALEADRSNSRRMMPVVMYWPDRRPLSGPRPRWYQFMPPQGWYAGIDRYRILAEEIADPGSIVCLGDEPMLLSEVSYLAAMRQAMISGTATPTAVQEFEQITASRGETMRAAMHEMAKDIVAHHGDPLIIVGMWSQHWAFMELARTAGLPNGAFDSRAIVSTGGGTKGADLPADYKQQVDSFYGGVRRRTSYGMSELSVTFPKCEVGRYHPVPWCVTLVLDHTGERLLNQHRGIVEGRAAFFDVALHGRWGGIVSADRITVDFDACECGRPGPTIADNVVRYTDLAGRDDKLSCAGTIDAYITGVIQS